MRRRNATIVGVLFGCAALWVAVGTGTGVSASRAGAYYKCVGPTFKLFANSNTQSVSNGGRQPTFNTRGKFYCMVKIATYHWNGGQGQTPGRIGLRVISGVGPASKRIGPWLSTGSSGQNGAPNANWTVTGAPLWGLRGTYACTDSDPATWSSNAASHGNGFCAVYVQNTVYVKGATMPRPRYSCRGPRQTIFDNTNGFGVSPGGRTPTFGTGGRAFCVDYMRHYHYNGGKGVPPGRIGLRKLRLRGGPGGSIGPLQARLSGTGLDWVLNLPGNQRDLIDGRYSCTDSGPGTWSMNLASRGDGFCIVQGVPAQGVVRAVTRGGASPTPPTNVPTVNPGGGGGGGPPTCVLPAGNGYKVNMTASATSGMHPLTVTFATCENVSSAGNGIQWTFAADSKTQAGRISCTNSSSTTCGPPPGMIVFTYNAPGTYYPELQVSDRQGSGGSVILVIKVT